MKLWNVSYELPAIEIHFLQTELEVMIKDMLGMVYNNRLMLENKLSDETQWTK